MDVGNIAHPEQWLDHPEGGALENVEVCMMKYGGKAKGKGKNSFLGECNYCGEWGHKAAQCPKRLTCWTCGEWGTPVSRVPQGQRQGKERWQGPARAAVHKQRGTHDQGSFDKGWGNKDEKGFGKNTFSKGKGKYGKGPHVYSNIGGGLESMEW